MRRLKIAVLFDGAGLARLGLEQAGHDCTGYEIDPAKHHLSRMVGSGNSVLADVRVQR
jgi:site-specific DNA-cytosine methylase